MRHPQVGSGELEIVIPDVDEGSLTVLLLDPPSGRVTYASPPAMALVGDAATLPATVDAWSRAAGLGPVAEEQRLERREWTDPVLDVARGGTVNGVRVELATPEYGRRAYWAVGFQLLAGEGASHGAMVAFFPLRTGSLPHEDLAATVDGVTTAHALLASSISFTITDPRQEDDPLIWVDPAFERMTGYRVDDVVGRNCRFLQGPGTDRAEVDRIRRALEAGQAVGAELLNYREEGTAFWNALAITPMLDGDGRVRHFVGVQTDVTAQVLAGIEHERLLTAEREAREAAERSRAQLALIENVGAMLGRSPGSQDVLQRVVDAAVPELGDVCTLDLIEPADGEGPPSVRRVAVAYRRPELASLYWQLAETDRQHPEQSYLARLLETGRSVLIPSMSQQDHQARVRDEAGDDAGDDELIRQVDVDSGAMVPLCARDRVIAVLSIGVVRGRGRAFGPDDLALAETLAACAALAVDNARLSEAALTLEKAHLDETQRAVALELQRSLLPDRLPTVPELDVAGRYLAGAAGTQVGGDWYDVVRLPHRRVMVAVGDVRGRGVRAAAVMGQIRSALRSHAIEGLAPAQLLERLAAFTAAFEGEHVITCVVGLFDAAAGSIELASAGHPPPLVVDARGRTRMLAVDPGLPLGVPGSEPGSGYTATRLALGPGDRLVLYTDGLIEGRDVPVGDGLRRLERGLGGMPPGSADDLCDAVLTVMRNTMRRPDPHDDDTAVLTLRVPPGCAAGTADTAASAGGGVVRVCAALQGEGMTGPANSRRLVREALAAHELADLVDSAVLLVSELVTNALRHGGGPQELSVDIDDGGVTVSVSDSSLSLPLERDLDETASGILPENGRGLILVAALADDWGWAQESSGKRVWFRLRTRSGAVAGTPESRPPWLG